MIPINLKMFSQKLLIATCAIIVAASALDSVFHFPTLKVLSEKRELNKLPDISKISIENISQRSIPLTELFQSYIAATQKFFDDNFGLRGVFVIMNNALKLSLFNESPVNTVVVGKNKWLYFAGDNNIDYYQNNKLFSNQELAQWYYTIEAKQRWLSERGIYYLMVIAPNKETIYPEYLPNGIQQERDMSLQDQLLQSLSPELKEHVLDLRSALRTAKKERQVYYSTDTHWNQEGAYRAYYEIMKKLNSRFPQLHPQERSEFIITVSKQRGGDLAGMLSLTNMFSGEFINFVSKKSSQPRPADIGYAVNEAWEPSAFELEGNLLPRAVIIHDSFGGTLSPFLSPHFKRVVYLLRAGIRFSTYFDIEEIKQEKPDIVIEEIAERKLYRFSPYVPDELLRQQVVLH